MAGIPTTGNIRMQLFARERLYGNYGGGGTITGPISMYNLMNGGSTGGGANSGNSYPAVNGQCGNVDPTIPNPPGNGSFGNWRGYYQDWICYYPTGSGHYTGIVPTRVFDACVPNPSGTTTSYWASAQLTNATTGAGWTVNSTILYSTNNQPAQGNAQTPLANKTLVIYYAGGATPNCYVETNGSGVITSINTC
jgi:hypothetical protein